MIEVFLIAALVTGISAAVVDNKEKTNKEIQYTKTYRLPAPAKCESCSFVEGTNKMECKVVYCTK